MYFLLKPKVKNKPFNFIILCKYRENPSCLFKITKNLVSNSIHVCGYTRLCANEPLQWP